MPENLDITTAEQFADWLKTAILKLSVDTLKEQAVTCTACGEILGTYIIDYKGERLRFSAEGTYAFLNFLLTKSNQS